MIPKVNIESLSNAPPENMFIIPNMPVLLSSTRDASAVCEMKGITICVPNLKTIKAPTR